MSRLRPRSLAARLAVVMFVFTCAPALAASPDNDVEWAGVSHVSWQDCRPLCPVDGETFIVRFLTWRDDVTSARLLVTINATTTPAVATRIGTRGPYDVWEAQVPATLAATEAYVIELTDGSDTDFYGPEGMSGTLPATGFELDFTTLAHAPVGATRINGGGTVFKVWAPTRSTVHVRGEFNGWGLSHPLTKVGEFFIGRVNGVADRAQYKFFFNNSHWNTDARGRSLNATDNYNARVEDPFRHNWLIDDFDTPPLEEMVIYQLHVGTFSGRNDPIGAAPHPGRYIDVAVRVGHLAELGVNAVQINPITEFPGDESAGYNPITMWAPEWKYGTPDELKVLIDALHEQGIAVILDVVWNHLSFSDNFLWYYDGSQQYFDTPEVDTPWGAQADFDAPEVADYYVHSALYWLEEFKVDGFRVDATSFMNIPPQGASGWALMQRMNESIDNRWANKVTIAEQLPDDPWVTRPVGLGGAGFDTQYFDWFTDELRAQIFAAALGNPDMGTIRDIIVGGGAYLSGRHVMNYVQLHDEAWPTSGGQRLVKTIDTTFPHDDAFARARMKLALGTIMFAPGVPAMLMGDEWLEDTDFGTGSFERIDWSKKTTYADHFAFVKRIIELRRSVDALRADRLVDVFHVNDAANVIAFRRTDAFGNPLVVVASFGNGDAGAYRIGVPVAGNWQELVNSQSSTYGGTGFDNPGPLATESMGANGFAQSLVLRVPATGILVLQPSLLVGVATPAPAVGTARIEHIAPLPTRDRATVVFSLPEDGQVQIDVLDLSGRLVARLVDGHLPAGAHTAHWSTETAEGRSAPPGVYFVRLVAAGKTEVRRLPLLR